MAAEYRDNALFAKAACWALYADALACAVMIAVALAMGGEALLYGAPAVPLAIVQLVTTFGALILFLIWFYRANANVRAIGADGLMGSPGLSVAWFFIPIAFLFMPYIVVRDTWKASAAPGDWQALPTPPLPGFWWAAFLGAHLAAAISFRLWTEGGYRVEGAVTALDLLSNAAGIAAALLGVEIVRRIQKLQADPAQVSAHFR